MKLTILSFMRKLKKALTDSGNIIHSMDFLLAGCRIRLN